MQLNARTIVRIAALAGLLGSALPALATVVVLSPLVHEHTVQPGGTEEGTIELQNPTAEPQEVKVYQTDYLFFADGRVLYGDPGQLPRSNARWISWTPKQVLIPPGERIKVRYTIQVPDDAALKGTYWSLLMIEPVPKGSPESSTSEAGQIRIGLRELVRYAIQVATHIGDTGTRQLRFAQIRLLQESGKRVLAVEMENTSERMLNGTLWLELYDPNGRYVGKYDGGRRRLYPGTSARFSVDLLGLEEVTYKSLIVVDCGGDDVFGASVNLVLGH